MRWLRIIAGALAWTTLIVAGTWWVESAAFSDHGQVAVWSAICSSIQRLLGLS